MGVDVLPEVVAGVTLENHCVVVAIGVTEKPVFAHWLVSEVKVFAISEFDLNGICN